MRTTPLRSNRFLWLCLLTAMIFASATQSSAQTLYGSIVGTITDASNASIPDATVTIKGKDTGVNRTTTTNSEGGFTIPTIQGGIYTIEVKKDGFRVSRQDNIEITANTVSRLDLKLTVGQVSESVTIEANAAVLQTDRSEVRAEITSKTLTELPVA
ncbi:MAG: carboxypeptidase-like regulatory domain-containing protein, partial [Acidobacteria bacterium]|nr:carboxypeptidase-like regulatory domain-containing protein [Acidobacteriota bacterium]